MNPELPGPSSSDRDLASPATDAGRDSAPSLSALSLNGPAGGQWYVTMAGIIDAAGTMHSLALVFQELASLVPFEMASVLVYRGKSRPVHLYDTFAPQAYKEGLDNYLRFSYVLNPCYQAYLDGISPGIFRIRDLVTAGYPDHDVSRQVPVQLSPGEEIGYVTRGWPTGREEVLIIVTLPDGAVAEIGLLRSRADGGFRDEHLARLREAEPLVAAVVRHYWRVYSANSAAPPDNRIDQAFEDFGKAVLSGRERSVVRLVLQGHSSESIGLHLGISITTVKTHRKNAYAKLNISTQSELLSLFLKTLGAA